MKMGIRPPHYRLQGPVEMLERNITRNQNAPPDGGTCAEEGHFDDVHFHWDFGLFQSAVSSAKNLAKERIGFSLSSRKPRSSSSLTRPSCKSLPKTCVSWEYR